MVTISWNIMNNLKPLHFSQCLSFTLLLLIGFFLSACATTEEPATPVVVEPAWKDELRTLSSSQLELNAINALLRNDEEIAARNVEILLEKSPNSKTGLTLEKQIKSDPEEILGTRFVVYPALEGESLMSIAERFTGDPLNFYSLAKFNDISAAEKIPESSLIKVPNRGEIGSTSDTIKNSVSRPVSKPRQTDTAKPLPNTETLVSKPLQAESIDNSKPVINSTDAIVSSIPEPEVEEKNVAEQAEALFSNHQYAELISLRNSNDAEFSSSPQLTEYVAASYLVLSEKAFAKKEMATSASYLNEVKQFNLPPALATRASNLESRLQVNALLDKANAQKQQGQLEQSLHTYSAIQAIEPGNSKAQKEKKKIVNKLTKDYYQASIVSRGNFDYKSELDWINKILKIDPTHAKSLQRKPIVERLVDQLN